MLQGLGALLTGVGLTLSALGAAKRNKTKRSLQGIPPKQLSNGKTPKATLHKVHSLEQRIDLMRPLIQKGKRDAVVRERVMQYFREYDVPERDTQGELAAIQKGLAADATGGDTKQIASELKAIYDGTRSDVRYRYDVYGVDTFQSPRRTLEFGGGDCDDYSTLLASMFLAAGYPVKLKVIETKKASKGRQFAGEPNWDHIYVMVGVPPSNPDKGKWIPVDGSLEKKIGWEAPKKMVNTSATFVVE